MKALGCVIVCALLISGCSSTDSATSPQASPTHMETMQANNNDIMFLDMMIPHHQQAVTMSRYALTHTKSPQVLALATGILSAQQPEIDLMQGWQHAWGVHDSMPHSMPMDGMLSESELADLSALRDSQFDKKFLAGMISHHQGAISMAQSILQNGQNLELKNLANSIISSQKAEIHLMKNLLK